MIKVSRMKLQKFVVESKGKMHNAFNAKNLNSKQRVLLQINNNKLTINKKCNDAESTDNKKKTNCQKTVKEVDT